MTLANAHHISNVKYAEGKIYGNLIFHNEKSAFIEFKPNQQSFTSKLIYLNTVKYLLVSDSSEDDLLSKSISFKVVNNEDRKHTLFDSYTFFSSSLNAELLINILKSKLILTFSFEANCAKYINESFNFNVNLEIKNKLPEENIIPAISHDFFKKNHSTTIINALSFLGNSADSLFSETSLFLNQVFSKVGQSATDSSEHILTEKGKISFELKDLNDLKNSITLYRKIDLKRKLFFNGCSIESRPEAWTFFLELDSINILSEKYLNLLLKYDNLHDEVIKSKPSLDNSFKTIEVDYIRTDRNSSYFKKDCYLQLLRKLLRLHCIFDENIYYIQGMNEIMAIMIYVFIGEKSITSELEALAFFGFQSFIRKFIVKYIKPDGIELQLGFNSIFFILQEINNPLFNHMNELQQGFSIFFVPWILMVFKRLYSSYSDTLRLWDSLICGYYLENVKNVSCSNIVLVICAIITSQFEEEIFNSKNSFEFANNIQNIIHSESAKSHSLEPTLLLKETAKIYDQNWIKGISSSLFNILYSLSNEV